MPIKDYLSLLTNVFTKNPDSNIGKLFAVVEIQITQLNEALRKTEEWRSVDRAKGSTLDLLGDNVNEKRGSANDDLYRIFIRGKSARSRCDGTINEMIRALSTTINCSPRDIHIENADMNENGIRHPATIKITTIPEELGGVNLSVNDFVQLVSEVVAAGISVHYYLTSTTNMELNYASATVSGELVSMGPRIITEVKSTGVYHHGSTTVSGEAVMMSPKIKTDIEVSGGHHYGSATVSGESLTTSPPTTTQVKVSGVYYQGLVMVSGEVVTISPPVSTVVKIDGQTYQGTVMISGELVELSPRIITGLKSTGQLSKSQISVSGEKIEIYPKGVQ